MSAIGEPFRIGLLWHSPSSGNLGVGALTVANLAIARDVALSMGLRPEFTIMGMREPNHHYLDASQAKLYPIDMRVMLSPQGYWSEVARQHCILDIGAGDSFADIYGAKRFFFLWATKMLAWLRRRPLLLSPQTIGPFTKGGYRLLARMALQRASKVIARDRLSLDALLELAPEANGALSIDVAFALPYLDRSGERGGRRIRVGLNVSGLLFNEAESKRNRFGLSIDYAEVMRRFIREMCSRNDVEVHLITHALHAADAWDDDGRIADRLAAEFPEVVRAPDFSGPSEVKSYISSLDFLVAGRMHACIAAVSSGVPVVPVAYSRKFAGLFGMLDYKWLVPVSGFDGEAVHAFLLDCFDRRATLARDAARGMGKVDELLEVYRGELRRFFSLPEAGK